MSIKVFKNFKGLYHRSHLRWLCVRRRVTGKGFVSGTLRKVSNSMEKSTINIMRRGQVARDRLVIMDIVTIVMTEHSLLWFWGNKGNT